MPHLIITTDAAEDMERCSRFLQEQAPEAALRARQVVATALKRLREMPRVGRPYDKDPALRELVIKFGKGAYLALYLYKPDEDAVYVLAIRHGREKGYRRH